MSVEDFIEKQKKVDQKLLDAVREKTGKKRSGKGRGPAARSKREEPMVITLTKGQVQGIKDAPEEFMKEKKSKAVLERAKAGMGMKEGGLAEATAKLKAKGFSDGGAVVKDKIVSIDKSPNSGLITVKGFGASRRT